MYFLSSGVTGLTHFLFFVSVVDSCLSNPCQNGGTCQATDGGFSCKCTDDRSGRFCEGEFLRSSNLLEADFHGKYSSW